MSASAIGNSSDRFARTQLAGRSRPKTQPAEAGVSDITVPLPRGRRGPGAARRHLRRFATSAGYRRGQELGDAELMVSELVTNAVAHGRGRPLLRMRDMDGAMWVAVQDGGDSFISPDFNRPSSPNQTPGEWGLPIVEKLADDWGIIEGGPTRVWFVKRLPLA